MKVNLTHTIDDWERYVVAKFLAPASTTRVDKERTRASRAQLKRFIRGAVRTAVLAAERQLPMRQYRRASKLRAGDLKEARALKLTDDQQRALQW